jgi:gliding motility-associated-like protein
VLNASAFGLGAGTYAIRMIRPDGTCKLAEKIITVEYPVPLASATPTAGCAPLVVQLQNETDPALSGTVLWDLGDGSTSASGTPMHTYAQPGTYDVRLTVTSGQGCTADSLFNDLITVYPTPTASFVPDTTIGCVGLPVIFTDTSTPAGNYDLTWSFGDGGISNSASPASHTYANPGTYNVMLMVTSDHGCTDDITVPQLIQILPTPAPSFAIDPPTGCIPLSVRFDNTTPDQGQQSAFWDLGNGQTDTALSTTGTYTVPGSYTVSLTMTNSLGCSATLTAEDTIHAYGLPTVTFSVLPGEGCAPLDVQFQNTTDPGMIGGCEWDFGDGSISTECITGHVFQSPGAYNVSLHVTSPAGCEGDTTLYQIVRVDPSPTAGFTFSPWPTDIFHPQVQFLDNSSPDVINWSWTFPQGSPATSADSAVSVTFPGDEGGTYPTELIVTNQYGCTDTLVMPVPVNGVFSVFVPNAFTPNADGVNELFVPVIKDADARGYDFRVFDRWGEEVFHTTEIGAGWDGTVNGEAPKTDVYSWKLRVRSAINAETRMYFGKVVVLR